MLSLKLNILLPLFCTSRSLINIWIFVIPLNFCDCEKIDYHKLSKQIHTFLRKQWIISAFYMRFRECRKNSRIVFLFECKIYRLQKDRIETTKILCIFFLYLTRESFLKKITHFHRKFSKPSIIYILYVYD